METHSFSAYKFANLKSIEFSAHDYSKFKYGSGSRARIFGQDLGKKFLDHLSVVNTDLRNKINGRKIVVTSSPYRYVPTSSTYLMERFVEYFNPRWSEDNSSVEVLKTFGLNHQDVDYGSLNHKEREQYFENECVHIDRNFISGKVLVCINDIKVTGVYEKYIEKILHNLGFDGTVIFLYYAEYTGTDALPVENKLNNSFIRWDEQLVFNNLYSIISEGEFCLNPRFIYQLISSDPKEFSNFIQFQSQEFKENLWVALTGEEIHKRGKYKENVRFLKANLFSPQITI